MIPKTIHYVWLSGEKAFREFDGLDMVKICASSNDYAA